MARCIPTQKLSSPGIVDLFSLLAATTNYMAYSCRDHSKLQSRTPNIFGFHAFFFQVSPKYNDGA